MPKEIEHKGKRKVQEDLLDPFLDKPTDLDFFLPDNSDPYAIDGARGNSPDGRQNHSVAKEGPRTVPGPAPTPLDATQTHNATLPGQFNITDMSSLLPAFQTFLQMQSILQGRGMAMGGMLPTQKKEIVDVEDDSDAVMFEIRKRMKKIYPQLLVRLQRQEQVA